jgi:hypothetical protein
MPTGSEFPHGVSFPQNEDATPEPSSELISRSYRVSSFRGLPQSASPPTRNCLDFGWRNRHLQKTVRWRGRAPAPAPQVVQSLSPRLIMIWPR